MTQSAFDRRTFVATAGSCAAHLLFLRSNLHATERAFGFTQGRRVVAEEPWGRLEELGPGLWGLVSTPLDGGRETLCNGGIIAGRSGVIVVESFASPEGARWMAEQARILTGRWPTHVVISHFHGDHSGGVAGYAEGGESVMRLTETTRRLIREGDDRRESVDPARARLLADAVVVPESAPSAIDLGDRTVRLVPRGGHTPSDVTVEIDEPSVVWCGDLVWNRMFPNYRDAIPTRLERDVAALERDRPTVYVPGHGPVGGNEDFARFRELIAAVEAAGRRAAERGQTAAEAAAAFTLPPPLDAWTLFSPRYYEVAIGAWIREQGG